MEQEKKIASFCSECGTKIVDGEKFCRNCGTPSYTQIVSNQTKSETRQVIDLKPQEANSGVSVAFMVIGIILLFISPISLIASLNDGKILWVGISVAIALMGLIVFSYGKILEWLEQNANNQYKIIELLWAIYQKNDK